MVAKLRHHIHLVGSIPLNDAAEVFETVSAALGPAIDRLPDGETGARLSWLGWLQPVFTEHPDLQQTEETRRKDAEGRPTYRFRLRPGTSGETVSFDALPQATVAIASYNVFARLKADGKIPGHVKFQVSIANPISVVDRFIVAGDRDAVQPRFVEALLDQVAEICASIPHDELALQWDVASAIFAPLEMNEPGRFGATKQEAYTTFAQNTGTHW